MRNTSKFNMGLMFALISLTMTCSVKAENEIVLIKNASVISMLEGQKVTEQDVLISNGKIQRISDNIPPQDDIEIFEAKGKYLMPGLIDSHVHLYHATGLKRQLAGNFDELYSEYMAQAPNSYLYFGFTSLIELNNSAKTTKRFTSGTHSPNIYHCGHGLVLQDGFMALEFSEAQFVKRFPHYIKKLSEKSEKQGVSSHTVNTPSASVKKLIESGAACIKMYYEEALWFPGERPEFSLPNLSLIKSVVAEADKYNVPVLLHATTPDGHKIGVDAGVDILAHGIWEWPGVGYDASRPTEAVHQVVSLVANSKTRVQPTVTSIRNTHSMFTDILNDQRWHDSVSKSYMDYLNGPAQRQKMAFTNMFGPLMKRESNNGEIPRLLDNFVNRYTTLIGEYYKLGGKLLFGTDTAVGGFGWGAPPGLSGIWEMEAWRKAGIPNEAILSAATIENAKAFGLDHKIGTVETGKDADLILLKENPLVNIDALDTIELIILKGKTVRRDSLSARNKTK